MLNGIGGTTVTAAKASMPLSEAQQWVKYIEKNGPINAGLRMDRGFALIAWTLNRAHGGKAEMKDFMPFPIAANEPATINEMFSILKSVSRKKVSTDGK